ncbi:hypothetical protein NG2371_07138 [Nocardia gamkensis]|nr:hypothetical protein [Nocardia gamkensis]
MPLFPGTTQNTDLTLALSQCTFRRIWTDWFQEFGLQSITIDQPWATQ